MKVIKTILTGTLCALLSMSASAAEQVSAWGFGSSCSQAGSDAISNLLSSHPDASNVSLQSCTGIHGEYWRIAVGYINEVQTQQVSAPGYGSNYSTCRADATSNLESNYPSVYNVSMSYTDLGGEVTCVATGTIDL